MSAMEAFLRELLAEKDRLAQLLAAATARAEAAEAQASALERERDALAEQASRHKDAVRAAG